jgi:flagellar biosynthetic protein FliR
MLFEVPQDRLIAGTLVLFRIASMIFAMPVLGGQGMPVRAKITLALLITLIVLPVLPVPAIELNGFSFITLLGLVIHESLLGLMIGFVAQLPVWAAQLAGQLIGLQMGLGIASVLDPESGNQESLPASFMRNCALVLFLVIGGHHVLLESLVESFTLVPAGQIVLNPELMNRGLELGVSVLDIGIRLGAPVMAALLLAEAGLGLVARTVPQMNIFIVGFPLKIALGLGLIAVTLPVFALLFEQHFSLLVIQIQEMIAMLAG